MAIIIRKISREHSTSPTIRQYSGKKNKLQNFFRFDTERICRNCKKKERLFPLSKKIIIKRDNNDKMKVKKEKKIDH